MTTNGKTILKGFYRFSFVFNHNSAASFPLIEELEKSQVDENWIGMEEEKKREKSELNSVRHTMSGGKSRENSN